MCTSRVGITETLLRGGTYMKSRLVKFFAFALLGALILGACELPGGTAKSVATGNGTVRISIPRINPYIVANQSKSLNSKAFAYVDTVVLDFYVNVTDAAPLFELTLGAAAYDPATNTIAGDLSVPAGTYGRVIVSVFNTDNAAGEQLVTAGQTDGSITINSGETLNLTVTLYPANPIALTSDYSDLASINQYGEKWYSFTAPGKGAVVQTQTVSGNVNAYIFGPDGLPAEIRNTIHDGFVSTYSLATVEGERYYVCLISPEGVSTGEVRFVNDGTLHLTIQ